MSLQQELVDHAYVVLWMEREAIARGGILDDPPCRPGCVGCACARAFREIVPQWHLFDQFEAGAAILAAASQIDAETEKPC